MIDTPLSVFPATYVRIKNRRQNVPMRDILNEMKLSKSGPRADLAPFLLDNAITHGLNLSERQLKSISKGIAEIKAGRATPHDDMITEWEATYAYY